MAGTVWKPEGARPIEMLLAVRKDGPASITLPVVPPIRGRVVDRDGKPVPDIAVGRWISFGSDGVGEVVPYFSGGAVSDRDGRFAITPEVQLKGSGLEHADARHLPRMLCFADPSFRRAACRFFDPRKPLRGWR